jgi:FkbM family methyltransferase
MDQAHVPLSPQKLSVKATIRSIVAAIGRTKSGAALFEQVNHASMQRTQTVLHAGTELTFVVPDRLNLFRVATFATKEPETLAWIDAIPRGAILWDVGANIGLYSCYAAKARNCRVVAFEPSVFNLELLARNIYLNEAMSHVTIVSLPLFAHAAERSLNMTTTQRGGALSTFGLSVGFDGAALKKVFEFRTVGLSMDECVSKLALPYPDYIKMDVDGIEHFILRGGTQVLRRVRSISIEINDEFAEQAETSRRLLAEAGLEFVSKAHSQVIEAQADFHATFNQVWAR